ncbi:MAG: hypothetical protein GC160_02765 [Acidobacteria bacterium]|nr:hypothetical protein [Acidobacteriota bacterium]
MTTLDRGVKRDRRYELRGHPQVAGPDAALAAMVEDDVEEPKAGPEGLAELLGGTAVRYGGPATGALYTREQVMALLRVAARRAARQAALEMATAAETLLPRNATTREFARRAREASGSIVERTDVSVWG